MRHYTRLKIKHNGIPVVTLIDDNGGHVDAFDHFVEHLINQGAAQRTIERYSDVVANFIDYLTAAGVFGSAVSLPKINKAVESYIPIRLRASDLKAKFEANTGDDFERWAGKIVYNLDISSLAPASLSNTLAAINEFLRLSERSHQLNIEAAKFHGLEVDGADAPTDILKALTGALKMSAHEKRSMMQNSMLASVMRLNPNGITRPKGLAAKFSTKKPKGEHKDFPMEYLPALLNAANSWRDRALWSLMAAGGLRTHEAAQTLLDNIDIQNRQVYIEDPESLRFSDQLSKKERLRFKGRTVSTTYLMQPLRDVFFDALEQYMRLEWTPGVNHDFVFQDIRKGNNGRPYYELSDSAQIGAFNRACDRAGVPRMRSGKRFGKHSLRHFYGVFMLNYIPTPGGYGLQLGEVQKLMGHSDISTTAQYARQDEVILKSKLMYADQAVMSAGEDLASLPHMIADRLEHEARKIRENI